MNFAASIISLALFFSLNTYAQEINHKLYGYSQLDYKSGSDPFLYQGFHLSRINLIDDFNLQENARFLIDVEFEDGTDIAENRTKGSVKVSRAFFEYNFKSNTSISVGKVLTPFGLFNETHDFSITYLPIEVPLPYRAFITKANGSTTRIFSKYSTGLSVKDTSKILQNTNWVNQFTVSNGMSETNNGGDNNHDKALSLKSAFKYTNEDNVYDTGLSLYTEKDSSVFGGSTEKRFWTSALHFKFENNHFNISTEILSSRFNSSTSTTQKAIAYYACAGYTINEKYTPYVLYSMAYRDLSNKKNNEKNKIVGVNTNLLQQVILKVEYTNVERDLDDVDKRFDILAANLSIAF
jgi:hypothetical protein